MCCVLLSSNVSKVMRDLKHREAAKLVMEGWLVHYNYIRPHESLGGETPGRVVRVRAPFRNWAGVLRVGGSP